MKRGIIILISLFTIQYLQIYAQEHQKPEAVLKLLKEFQNVRDFTISRSEKEAYISAQSSFGELSAIIKISKTDNEWRDPEIASFSGQYNDLEPFLSPDNLKLYFVSNRPVHRDSLKVKDFDIWYVQRKSIKSNWSEPINLGAPVNTSYNEFYPSVAENNNLYFTCDYKSSKGKDDIFFSAWDKNKYTETVSMSDAINSEGYEFNAYVAPDESFLIFSGYQRKDGFGSGDLYISFKDEKNNWKKAINLGDNINSAQMDYCPFVDNETKTLYFTSKRNTFKEKYDFKTIKDLLDELNKEENGLSKIYKVPFEKILLKVNK